MKSTYTTYYGLSPIYVSKKIAPIFILLSSIEIELKEVFFCVKASVSHLINTTEPIFLKILH